MTDVIPPDPPPLPNPDTDQELDPTIRVLMPDGTVQEFHMETYLRGVVPAEMPALWPMDALKAQAIAARTYATYAIAHPHYDNADICTTTATQVYNPDKIHRNTDQAIRETAGMLILYDAEPIQAFYSANCGGHTQSNQAVWGGKPRPYLTPTDCINFGHKNGHGVGMCQFGARDMAEEGVNYQDILHHYYTRVIISPRAIGAVSPKGD